MASLASASSSSSSHRLKAISTADDATVAKAKIASFGYVVDPVIADFVLSCGGGGLTRRPPSPDSSFPSSASTRLPHNLDDAALPVSIAPSRFRPPSSAPSRDPNSPLINRGYFARVAAIDSALQSFLSTGNSGVVQVVELGAGKSSLFWRFVAGCLESPSAYSNPPTSEEAASPPPRTPLNKVRWFESDYPSVIESKKKLIERSPGCKSLQSSSDTVSSSPTFVPCDLSDPDVPSSLSLGGVDPSLPTLFILEAVLMYMSPSDVTRLLSSLGSHFPFAHLAIYDTMLKKDAFGKMMCENLRRAGIDTSGLEGCRDLDSHVERVRAAGFQKVLAGRTMLEVYDKELSGEQRRKAAQREMLDEVEEWNMIMGHYCFVTARNYE